MDIFFPPEAQNDFPVAMQVNYDNYTIRRNVLGINTNWVRLLPSKMFKSARNENKLAGMEVSGESDGPVAVT